MSYRELIILLTVLMLVSALLSSLFVLIGSSKEHKKRSVWYFITNIFGILWASCVAVSNTVTDQQSYEIIIVGAFVFSLCLATCAAIYASWGHRIIMIVVLSFSLLSVAAIIYIIFWGKGNFYVDPNVETRYIGLSVSHWSVWVYAGIITALTILEYVPLALNIKNSETKRQKNANIVLLSGLVVVNMLIVTANFISLFFNIGITLVGPIAFPVLSIIFYLSALLFGMAEIKSRWLRYSSVVIFSLLILSIYFTVISIIINGLPANQGKYVWEKVIFANNIVLILFVVISPFVKDLWNFLKARIYLSSIDTVFVEYAVTNLRRYRYADIGATTVMLSTSLHLDYIGLFLDDKIIESSHRKIPNEVIKKIIQKEKGFGRV